MLMYCSRSPQEDQPDVCEAEDDIDIDGEPASKKARLEDAEKPKVARIWFDKEVKIAEAHQGQVEWKSTMQKTLETLQLDGLKLVKDRRHLDYAVGLRCSGWSRVGIRYL